MKFSTATLLIFLVPNVYASEDISVWEIKFPDQEKSSLFKAANSRVNFAEADIEEIKSYQDERKTKYADIYFKPVAGGEPAVYFRTTIYCSKQKRKDWSCDEPHKGKYLR